MCDLGQVTWTLYDSVKLEIIIALSIYQSFPVALEIKNLPANAGDIRDVGLTSGWRKSPGEGNGNPLQYSCLDNPMDRGVWRATVHGVTKSWPWLKRQHARTSINSFSFLIGRPGALRMRAFSRCSRQGLLSSCGARVAPSGGVSCCRARALGARASVVAGCRLISCGEWA